MYMCICVYMYIYIYIYIYHLRNRQSPAGSAVSSGRVFASCEPSMHREFSNAPKGNGIGATGSKNPHAY